MSTPAACHRRRTLSLLGTVFVVIAAVAALSIGAWPASGPENAPDLDNIVVHKDPGRLTILFRMDGPVAHESFILTDPNRIVFDLHTEKNFETERLIPVDHLGVRSIRTARNKPGVIRIVIDCSNGVPPHTVSDSSEGITVSFKHVKEDGAAVAGNGEPAPAETAIRTAPSPAPAWMLTLGPQAGFNLMSSEEFRDLYGQSTMFSGGDFSLSRFLDPGEALGISLDIKMIRARGTTSFLGEDIELRLTPLSASVFYLRRFGNWMPYIGIGPILLSYREIYPEGFPVSEISGKALGIGMTLGIFVGIWDRIMAKAFIRLRNVSDTNEEEQTVSFSGREFGVSLGYRFNF